MKRLFILALCLLLCGCTVATTDKKGKNLRIGVAIYTGDDTFISSLVEQLTAEAKAWEADRGLRIQMEVVNAKSNQSSQNTQIDSFLEKEFDVIFVNMVDRTAAATIVDKAKTADIPLIFFNREPVEEDLNRWSKVFYVGSKAEQSGLLQGEIVLDAYRANPETVDKNGDGILQYVMLEGEHAHQDTLIRTESCTKALKYADIPLQKLASSTANWQRAQADNKMNQWLGEFGHQIEVVFANNDDMALGAIDALKRAEHEDFPVIVGIDATEVALKEILDGNLTGTALNDISTQARAMFDILAQLLYNEKSDLALIRDKYFMADYRIVTEKNVRDIVK